MYTTDSGQSFDLLEVVAIAPSTLSEGFLLCFPDGTSITIAITDYRKILGELAYLMMEQNQTRDQRL